MKERQKGAIGGVTRREALEQLAKAGLALGLVGVSALDRLGYAVAAELNGGRPRPLDWSCGANVWYQCLNGFADCPGGAGHDCDQGFVCPTDVQCNAEPSRPSFQCWNPPGPGGPYGCTGRVFRCENEYPGLRNRFICGGDQGGDAPYDFACDVSDHEFQCGTSWNGGPNANFVCSHVHPDPEYVCDVTGYRC